MAQGKEKKKQSLANNVNVHLLFLFLKSLLSLRTVSSTWLWKAFEKGGHCQTIVLGLVVLRHLFYYLIAEGVSHGKSSKPLAGLRLYTDL